MTDPFEKQLRDALCRQEPPPGFAVRVGACVKRQSVLGSWFVPLRMRWAVAVVLLVAAFGGALIQHQRQRRLADGEAAKQQVMVALQIAGAKVRLAQIMVQQISEGSGRDR